MVHDPDVENGKNINGDNHTQQLRRNSGGELESENVTVCSGKGDNNDKSNNGRLVNFNIYNLPNTMNVKDVEILFEPNKKNIIEGVVKISKDENNVFKMMTHADHEERISRMDGIKVGGNVICVKNISKLGVYENKIDDQVTKNQRNGKKMRNCKFGVMCRLSKCMYSHPNKQGDESLKDQACNPAFMICLITQNANQIEREQMKLYSQKLNR